MKEKAISLYLSTPQSFLDHLLCAKYFYLLKIQKWYTYRNDKHTPFLQGSSYLMAEIDITANTWDPVVIMQKELWEWRRRMDSLETEGGHHRWGSIWTGSWREYRRLLDRSVRVGFQIQKFHVQRLRRMESLENGKSINILKYLSVEPLQWEQQKTLCKSYTYILMLKLSVQTVSRWSSRNHGNGDRL